MQTQIHPTAIVEEGARLGAGVRVGPYCLVGAGVSLGDGVELKSHVVVEGQVSIGARTLVYPFVTIGVAPQDLKYKGEISSVEIGTDNVIREHVSIHAGTQGGGLVTRVGNHCLFMVNAHIAHDCQVGDRVVLANNVALAGHVSVGDHAIIGGNSAVHQFVRIGAHAMVGGMSGIEADVIPYGVAMGERAHLQGLNIVGMKRRGFSHEMIHELRRVYKDLFERRDGAFADAVAQAQGGEGSPAAEMLGFLRSDSGRSFCQPVMREGAGK